MMVKSLNIEPTWFPKTSPRGASPKGSRSRIELPDPSKIPPRAQEPPTSPRGPSRSLPRPPQDRIVINKSTESQPKIGKFKQHPTQLKEKQLPHKLANQSTNNQTSNQLTNQPNKQTNKQTN